MKPIRAILFAAFAVGFGTRSALPAATSPSATEFWEGRAGNASHGVTLQIAVTPADGTGTITIPELGARGIPLDRAQLSPTSIELVLSFDGDPMTFSAQRDGDRATGTYAMGPMKGALELHRTTPPTLPYSELPLSFASGDVSLDGTLLLPRGTPIAPAVVFLHGSGKATRDGNRFSADALARRGIAVLIYDKRGSGRSTGDLRSASYDELAGDAVAAVSALRGRREIDGERICLAGASQAGWIGTLAATKTSVRCLAFTSAPAVDVASENWWDYEAALRRGGFGEEAIAAARRLIELDFAVTRDPARWPALESAVAAAHDEPWFRALDYEPLPANDAVRVAFRRSIDFDPLPHLRSLQIDALWLYGGNDRTVPAAWSIDNLAALMKEGKSYTIRLFPHLDHTMMTYPDDLGTGGWPHRSPEHAAAFVSWLSDELLPR